MKKSTKKQIAVWLARAEELAPTDPEAALAVKALRSALEPPKPRDLMREELRDKLNDYALSILDNDAPMTDELADDIRKRIASQGLQPPSESSVPTGFLANFNQQKMTSLGVSKSSEKLNNTQGTVVSVPCSQCSGRTSHEVVLSVDQTGEFAKIDYHWITHFQIVRCCGCRLLSFREASSNSHAYNKIADCEWEFHVDERLYPSRLEGLKDLGAEARYLPVETKRVYEETIKALNNNSPVLAGIGLRALVETVCKERKAKGPNLQAKIDNLATQNVLTPAGAIILHKIRTLGNAAAHEVKPHSESQLALGMGIVEHMLRAVYILPKLADEEFPP